MARYSHFAPEEKNTFGYSRGSRFAGIKMVPPKATPSEDLKKSLISRQKLESRRDTIVALAKAFV